MKWFRLTPQLDGGLSDEEAMRRVRLAGDPAAFAQLVGRWEAKVRRLCVRMTGDEHRGEDLAQEAFARVFANRHRYDPRRRFSTWLWRVALNLCYEHARRAAVRDERPFADEVEGGTPASRCDDAGPHEAAEAAERAALVRDALARLPDAHRAVVVLRQYEGLKFREIADVLDMAEGTVKWRMTEALDQLGRELKPLAAHDHTRSRAPSQPSDDAAPMTMTTVTMTTKASVAL
jgi:RNA polymerase sigma-70 factor (ECF subfamily)